MRSAEVCLLLVLRHFLCRHLVDARMDDFQPESHRNWKLLPSAETCGLSFEPRIVGGSEAPKKAFPWIARIGYRAFRPRRIEYECAGSLISQYYVLTAAHCAGSTISHVRLGEYNTLTNPDCDRSDRVRKVCAPPVQDIPVADVIVHELFASTLNHNDVALLRLETPPTLNAYVQAACLPFGNGMKMDFENETTKTAGWGVTENETVSSVLRTVSLKVYDHDKCVQDFESLYDYTGDDNIPIYDSQICAGGIIGKDACQADSGGPLMWTGSLDPSDSSKMSTRTYLIGITSFGIACGVYELPGVYTRVSYFMRWILDHMEV